MKHAATLIIVCLALFLQDVHANGLVSRPHEVGHRNFRDAKKVLPRIYQGHEFDFYCGCRYDGKQVDLKSCGYKVRKDANRASRIEWEHVVPAWVIGHQRQCWQEGGRRQCVRTDRLFNQAEGDLHNLVPAIGELNNDRGNYRFTVWEENPSMYGQCAVAVDFKQRRVQPRPDERGKIARIYFYMHDKYGMRMSQQERRLFCAWHRTYPVDAWELERDRRIAAIQGNHNPYVVDPLAASSYCGNQDR